MSNHSSFQKVWLAVAVVLFLSAPVLAQSGGGTRSDNRSRAIDLLDSRAEREAEELVSLSATKIIDLLREESGLLLQVKKLLVRKAYEQGRLLDPQELTDEALFSLIREDEHIRVLITREIEDRNYIRAKPTRDELEREQRRQALALGPLGAAGAPGIAQVNSELLKSAKNQEEVYWLLHEHDSQPGLQKYSAPPSPAAPAAPAPPAPGSQAPTNDTRRELLKAQGQPREFDYFDSMTGDGLGLAPISPGQLPALLSASSTDSSLGRMGTDETGGKGLISKMTESNGFGQGAPSSTLPFDASQGSSLDTMQGAQDRTEPPQLAALDYQMQSQARNNALPWRAGNPALRHRPNPYADVPSLYDLYAQYSPRSPILERFGQDIFRNGTGNLEMLPMDLPVGPDYVVGPGDMLAVNVSGSVSRRLQRVVDRTGRVALPEVGLVEVAGRNLGDIQQLVQGVLRTQFRYVQADISLSRLRSVRVYIVGDVERPGAYDVSSLSTPLNALYMAGGPTARGSLRLLQHFRGTRLVQQVDVYDLLLHGIRSGVQGLQSGDTILVPPLGPEARVEGMVRRPATYELLGEKSLAQVLELAGGVLQSGTLRHVDVERVESHASRTMLRLDIPENNSQVSVSDALDQFTVQDGDRIKISPILPYAEKTIYLDGHVFRPGKYAFRDGMKVTDLIKSYSELLPEPYKRHAEVIRLNPPDYTPTVLAFNLDDALAGKDQDLVLKPFDTVRIFGRFDFEDPPVVTVTGAVRDPGDHISNGASSLRDIVYLAGGPTPDARLSDAQVFRKTENGKLRVISVDLNKALAGDPKDNIRLETNDRVLIHRNLNRVDPPVVKIEGEVARPGKYPLGEGMTAADLVRVAGGFKRGAYTAEADLTRYEVENGAHVAGEHLAVPIAKALAGEPDTDLRLHDGDVLTVRQVSGWNDIGATIMVKGEVVHPGSFGIEEGERLSSVIARAGGLRADAYPYGAVFERAQVKEMEQRNRTELIRTLQEEGGALRLTPAADPDDRLAKDASILQWKTTMEHLQNSPPSGRLVIHISSNIKRWANSPADIEVRAGDVLYIPKKPNLVTVTGAVYNPTAVTYRPGKSAGWYLSQAGGPTNMAMKKGVFVIRADGSVAGGRGGLFIGSAEDAVLMPGDVVVVPEKALSGSSKWRNTLQAAQLAQAVAIAIQIGRTF